MTVVGDVNGAHPSDGGRFGAPPVSGELRVLTGREASMFAAFADAVVAPDGRLPAVRDTDTVRAFDAALLAAPALNRLGLRALIAALEVAPVVLGRHVRLRRLDAAERAATLARLDAHALAGPVVKVMRSIAHLCYYGDLAVMAGLGYDPERTLARARTREPTP